MKKKRVLIDMRAVIMNLSGFLCCSAMLKTIQGNWTLATETFPRNLLMNSLCYDPRDQSLDDRRWLVRTEQILYCMWPRQISLGSYLWFILSYRFIPKSRTYSSVTLGWGVGGKAFLCFTFKVVGLCLSLEWVTGHAVNERNTFSLFDCSSALNHNNGLR